VTAEEIALAALKTLEGCKLAAYQDQGGVWTIGYGHTGPDVHPRITCTQEQADRQLALDLARFAKGVRTRVQARLSQHQLAALMVFSFNVGLGAFFGSTLLRELDAGHLERVPAELARWTKVSGATNRGLVARRAAEITIWDTPDAPEAA
jgi:lysozyme